MLELYEDHLVSVLCVAWCSFFWRFSHYSELSNCVRVGIWLINLLAISTREISGAAGAPEKISPRGRDDKRGD